jgi:translation initiation factor IF-1
MAKDKDVVVSSGVVVSHCKSNFKVALASGNVVKAKPSGKMRLNNINVDIGDKVELEFSPMDLSNGRIIRRG